MQPRASSLQPYVVQVLEADFKKLEAAGPAGSEVPLAQLTTALALTLTDPNLHSNPNLHSTLTRSPSPAAPATTRRGSSPTGVTMAPQSTCCTTITLPLTPNPTLNPNLNPNP